MRRAPWWPDDVRVVPLTVGGVPARDLEDLLRLAGPGRAVLVDASGEVTIIPDPRAATEAR